MHSGRTRVHIDTTKVHIKTKTLLIVLYLKSENWGDPVAVFFFFFCNNFFVRFLEYLNASTNAPKMKTIAIRNHHTSGWNRVEPEKRLYKTDKTPRLGSFVHLLSKKRVKEIEWNGSHLEDGQWCITVELPSKSSYFCKNKKKSFWKW